MSVPQNYSFSSDATAAEQELILAVASGLRAELAGKTIRASVIRDLAIEIRDDWSVQPAGIRIYDAVIDGELDLEGCTVSKPLLFFRCRFGEAGERDERLQLRDAKLRRLGLYQCIIHGGFKADRVQIESAAFLQGAVVNGCIRLRGAEIGGSLSMEEAVLNDPETALVLDNAVLGGPWLLRSARVKGELRLPGARIRGGVLAEAAQFSHKETAITADGVQINGPMVMNRAQVSGRFLMRGAEVKGVLLNDGEFDGAEPSILGEGARIDGEWSMQNAVIKGGIDLTNAHINGRLNGDGVQLRAGKYAFTGGGILIRQGLRMNSATLYGSMRIDGAEIGKQFVANRLRIDSNQRAFSANVVKVGGDWIMRGANIKGSMRLPGADIEGQLALTESTIKGGVLAIRADGSRIRGGWFMGRAEVLGRVRFPASSIGNQVRFKGSRFKVEAGPAIAMNGTSIKRDLILSEGFISDGGIALDQVEVAGTTDLRGSKIKSAIIARECKEAKSWDQDDLVERYDRIALSMVDAKLDRLQMPETKEFRPMGIIDLSRAEVGTFEDYADAWPSPLRANGFTKGKRECDSGGTDIDHFVLDGFAYEHLENPSGLAPDDERNRRYRTWEMRVDWLSGQSWADLMQHFKPQAWVQLAKRLSAQGYHEDARQISIARRRRHRKSGSVRRRSQLQSYLLDLFALFGFNPWRTIAWMVLFVVIFAGVWHSAAIRCALPGCADESVFVRNERGRYSQNQVKLDETYPPFNALAYSFDLFIPVISFGYQDYWRPNTHYAPIGKLTTNDVSDWFSQTFNWKPDWLLKQAGDREVVFTWGGVLYLCYIVEMILGLVLTSLAVTGFTGLLRRDE